MRLAGVSRVSSDEQIDGVSLDSQAAKLAALAEAEGHELVEMFADGGYTGGDLNRPGIRAALAGIDAGTYDGLAVAKLDRLTRSIRDWVWLGENYFFPPRSAPLLVAAGPIDLRTASGRMVVAVQVVISEYELQTIRERVSDSMAFKRSRNEILGHKPFGYELADDGKTLVPLESEQGVLAHIRSLHSQGRSLREIAAALNAEGVPTKRGGIWKHTVISKLLASTRGISA